MNESVSEQPITPQVAAYVGIDWADQKHDVVLRSVDNPAKAEHQVIKSELNALNDWIAQMHERFGAKGKVLVCLEQSRGALIYQLMAYELFELYPINPSQLANYRKTFFSSGAKDDGPDADLLSELLMCHRDRLKAWKPDDQLTRELATLNEGRRNAVDRRTELANEIKSQLKLYFLRGHIKRLVIYLDNGPKNSGRRTQFLKRMVQFADWSGWSYAWCTIRPTTASTIRSNAVRRPWRRNGTV